MFFKNILKKYKYSLALYLFLTFFIVFVYNDNFFKYVFIIVKDLNWKYMLVLPIFMHISVFSFALVFFVFSRVNNNNIDVKQSIKLALLWTFFNIEGKDGDSFIKNRLKIDQEEPFFKKLAYVDYIGILILGFLTFLFLDKTSKFYQYSLIFTFISVFFLLFFKRKYCDKEFILKMLPVNIFKYVFEITTPLFWLLIFDINIDPFFIVFFTVNTCILYYIPKFKLAGGLLTLYMIIFLGFEGHSMLFGWTAATFLRLCSVFIYSLPIFLINKYIWKEKDV